ncbi:MAG TPA: kelch repeat-containing protein [Vicinamibacterales bacterium]|nr:kelch repeat-containing protein [Vicinamibacterales bacterium]
MPRRLAAGIAPLLAALALAALVPTAAAAQSAVIDWSRQPQSGPTPRIEDTWVYDSVSARFVLFGGYDLNWNRLNDIWEYNPASKAWTDVTPAAGAVPQRRSGHAMAFDPVRRIVIVFGGLLDDQSYLNDTWEWNTVAKTWTNVTPGTSPAPRQGARLVYDSVNGRLVLVGGVDANNFSPETWIWNLSARTWTKLTTTASSPTGRPFVGRTFAGATFNPTAGHGVTIFGGIGFQQGSNTVVDFNDTWELRGTVWTDVTPGGGNPPGRGWTQLVWDPLFNRIVMTAGYQVGPPAHSYGDTWSFVNGGWSEIVPVANGPGIRDSYGMAYDTARNKIVLFGGYLADVLELDGATWSQAVRTDWPPSQDRHVMAYDNDRDVMFLYGGGSSEAWEYTFATQTWGWYYVLGPGARVGAAMVYERARQKMLLFGGRTRVFGALGSKNADTWQWDTTARTWTNISPGISPSARDDHAMAYDPARNRVILFGGRNGAGNALGDTWLWNGSSWTDVTATANGPSARFGSVMAYDAVRQTVVLFGGDTGAQKRNETFEWDGQLERWVQKFPGGSLPPARAFAALSSFDTTAPGVLLFGGSGASLLNDSWVWNGAAWTQLASSGATPTARQYPVMVYNSAARRVLLYGGRDSRGPSYELWGAVAAASAISPVPISVTPSQGGGAQTTLVARYRHAGGAGQIAHARVIVNSNLAGANALYLDYTAASNTLALRNVADTAWTAGVVGSAGVLSNGLVSIDLAGVSVSTSATDLVLQVPVIFQPAFNGPKNIYLQALDSGGAAPAGWLHAGTFFVNAGNSAPQAISVSPNSGSGTTRTFTFVYRDANGASDLQHAFVLIKHDLSGGGGGVYVYYQPSSNLIFLRNDADTAWLGGVAPGANVVLANSQVSINIAQASAVKSATDVALSLPMTFTANFAGAKNVWLFAYDASNATPGQWVQVGTWTAGQRLRDITVFRPGNGTWYSIDGASNWTIGTEYQWGTNGDIPVRADFDGDDRPDLVIYRPSSLYWYIRFSSQNFNVATWAAYAWGQPGDIPVAGDFDGDRKADLVTYRPSSGTWNIRFSSSNFSTSASYQWGWSDDTPLSGDFDGDGRNDLAVYRPSTGIWYVSYSAGNYTNWTSYAWGVGGDVPVAGDYDGDGLTDIVVYRPNEGRWFLRFSAGQYNPANWAFYDWGVPGDLPVAGDFDDDGKADLVVYRPGTATWYLRFAANQFSTAGWRSFVWGAFGDIPLSAK